MAYFEPIDPAQRPAMPYRRIKRRSHRGLGVVLALAVMAMSAGALWVGYRLSLSRQGGEVPLIHADSDPVKVKPDDPGGMEILNRDRFVFNPKGGMPIERLLPPPEVPLPRPAPAPATVPQVLVPAGAVPAPPTGQAPAVSAPPQSAAIPATGAGGYRLQVGAVKTPEMAKQEWDRIKRQNGDLVGSLSFAADRADLGERGVFYRIHAGPIADAAQAERVCGQLRQRGVGCILVKP
jgi:sporulation related protein